MKPGLSCIATALSGGMLIAGQGERTENPGSNNLLRILL